MIMAIGLSEVDCDFSTCEWKQLCHKGEEVGPLNAKFFFFALLDTDMASGTRSGRNNPESLLREQERQEQQRQRDQLTAVVATAEVTNATAVVTDRLSNGAGLVSNETRQVGDAVQQIATDAVGDEAGVINVPIANGGSPNLVLSAEERAFIREMRSNTATVQADELPRPPAQSADEEAYASILGPVEAFSRVHAHCLGVISLSKSKLIKEVKKELQVSSQWEDEDFEKLRPSLANALPKLGEVLLRRSALPVPSTFSAYRVVEVYRNILERFLMATKMQGKKKSSKGRLRDKSSSDEYSVSDKESSSSDEDDEAKEVSKAVKWHIKSSEKSLRIGESSYSQEHLYECERLLVEYKQWSDPIDPSKKLKTVPHEVRKFVKKHLATPGAPIMQAYDQPHVKGSSTEQKHVTFLLNKMGYLASRIGKERLSRAGKEIDRFGRIRKGAEMSKAERKESIEGEREWAGLVRWLSDMLAKGVEAYKVFQKYKNADASLAHLLVGAPELSRSSVRRAARAVANCKVVSFDEGDDDKRGKGHNNGNNNNNGNRGKNRNRNKRRRGVKITAKGPGNKRDKKDKRRCWHCNEVGHLTGDCPSAIAGKAPHPKSRFGKARSKQAEGEDSEDL